MFCLILTSLFTLFFSAHSGAMVRGGRFAAGYERSVFIREYIPIFLKLVSEICNLKPDNLFILVAMYVFLMLIIFQ